MSFWSTDFMNDRRKQWLNALVKFQYLVNGTWYDATINTNSYTGMLEHTDSEELLASLYTDMILTHGERRENEERFIQMLP